MGQSSTTEKIPATGEYIYVLELTQGKYYVGKTKDIRRRFAEHLNGQGSEWTKKYKPVTVLKTFPMVSKFDEDSKVKELMSIHGINNVRGGTYSQVYLTKEVKDLLGKELTHAEDKCFGCGKKGHFVANCPEKVTKQTKITSLACTRCHRSSHLIQSCNAYNTREGDWLCSTMTKSALRCRNKVGEKGARCRVHTT